MSLRFFCKFSIMQRCLQQNSKHANGAKSEPQSHTVRGVVVRIVCPFTSLLGAGRGSHGSAPRLLIGGVA